MNVREIARYSSSGTDPRARQYVERVVGPFVGPVRRLMLLSYDDSRPALFTVLPELADIHRRAGLAVKPEYHVGGFGFLFEEAILRGLGEAVERSSHVAFHVSHGRILRRSSQRALASEKFRFLAVDNLGRFSVQQRSSRLFPFGSASDQSVMLWAPTIDLRDYGETWLPVQVLTTGYPCSDGEPRVTLAVTSGTAAHVDYARAFLSALLELLQVDAAMGHWYSLSTAPRIDISARSTPRFASFMELYERWHKRGKTSIEFYWLRQPDGFPIYVAFCALRQQDYPALATGLGTALDLEEALYHAFKEACPGPDLAMFNALQLLYGPLEDYFSPDVPMSPPQRRAPDLRSAYGKVDFQSVMDFDMAVGYYALPEHADGLFPARFDPQQLLTGEEIRARVAPRSRRNAVPALAGLLAEVAERHRLFALDLGAEDTHQIGLHVVRVYSPDLLTLSAPSWPEADHPRFRAYGGWRSSAPHPYA